MGSNPVAYPAHGFSLASSIRGHSGWLFRPPFLDPFLIKSPARGALRVGWRCEEVPRVPIFEHFSSTATSIGHSGVAVWQFRPQSAPFRSARSRWQACGLDQESIAGAVRQYFWSSVWFGAVMAWICNGGRSSCGLSIDANPTREA